MEQSSSRSAPIPDIQDMYVRKGVDFIGNKLTYKQTDKHTDTPLYKYVIVQIIVLYASKLYVCFCLLTNKVCLLTNL